MRSGAEIYLEIKDLMHDVKIVMARRELKGNFEKRKVAQKCYSGVELKAENLVLLRITKLSEKLKRVTAKFFHSHFGAYVISKECGRNACQLIDQAIGKKLLAFLIVAVLRNIIVTMKN